MFKSKEPLIKTKEKYDSIGKRRAFDISQKQTEVRQLQLESTDLAIKIEELSQEIKKLQTEMLEAQAKSKAVQELLDNNELFA